MDIYTYLKKDHRLVSDLMEEVLATEDVEKRKTLFTNIRQELTLHADTEQVTFYKAIEEATRSKKVQEKMEHAEDEHKEIRMYLKKIVETPANSKDWLVYFKKLKKEVTHHVEEEENEIFDTAKKYLNQEQAKQLVHDMEALKKQQKERLVA